MNPQDFFRTVRKGEPAPVYFFKGSEIYHKNKAIKTLVDAIPEGQRDFNYDLFYGGEAELDAILTAARTFPFLAARRVVVFRDLDRARLGTAKAEMLLDYLRDPPPETVFVVTTEDAAAARTWSRKGTGLWTEVDFRPLKGAPLAAAIRDAAGERGVRITAEAAERLVETAGNDLGRITRELDKLSLAVEEGGRIDAPTVNLMVGGYTYQTAFDLVQAVCERDVQAALVLIERLFVSGGEAVGVIGMLAKRLRAMWFLAGGEGGAAGKVPPSFRMMAWQLKDLRRQASRFSRTELEGFLADLLRIDRLTKSAPVSSRLLLERFVLSLKESGSPRPSSL